MPKERGALPYVFYIVILLASVAALWGTLQLGEALTPAALRPTEEVATLSSAFGDFSASVTHHVHSTIGVLLLQILVILLAARIMGWVFRKMRQPAVIGEIVAGILLGPSLFGRVSPELFGALFPTESLPNIQLLSNFGLILFMFAIGMISAVSSRVALSLAMLGSSSHLHSPYHSATLYIRSMPRA